MLEYIFFDERPWRRFIEFLQDQEMVPETSKDDEGWLVMLPEDIDDDLNDRVEAFYDKMLDFNEILVAEAEGEGHVHAAGVNITLKDGRTVQAAIDPKIMRRLLEVVTAEELGDLVNAIADAVENPDQPSICQR
ncbi:hypothetical protein DJ030_11590 [bacterium endosymbiont of Escarpia laminata]|nr:MAG: hypothetical protein DJ030_11590 [bacterium endosymbiont of Escarpia laminata]RLJ21316.1 MAG: hypothetical protein DJ031_03200 [bacterium endosymbiont of Escarpia laminata]